MTPPAVQRHLVCSTCGHRWQIDVGSRERCPECDGLGEGICACGCESSLVDLRSDAVYRSEACAKRLLRAGRPDRDPTEHPLETVRGDAEESREKARWTLVVREQIAHTLIETGYFSAEALDSLGVPEPHLNVCTSWIGHFSKAKLMKKRSWHYSDKPSRKGGLVWTFQITDEGRQKLPPLLEEIRNEIAGAGATGQVGARGQAVVPSGNVERRPAKATLNDASPDHRQPVAMAANSAFSPDSEWE